MAKKYNYKFIVGEYIKTQKNNLVKNHYSDLGFEKKDNNWTLDLSSFNELKTHIKVEKNEK